MCACVLMWVGAQECAGACMCRGQRASDAIPQEPPAPFEVRLLTGLGLYQVSLGCVETGLQRATCLGVSSTRITSVRYHTWL